TEDEHAEVHLAPLGRHGPLPSWLVAAPRPSATTYHGCPRRRSASPYNRPPAPGTSSAARSRGETSMTTRASRFTAILVASLLSGARGVGALAQGPSKSSLMGKLEGPEVVTDAGKAPKTFKEAPQLAEQVKAGKLPPVAERIGQDPLVIKPLHAIGKYGGT